MVKRTKKAKKWFLVQAPDMFGNTEIGEAVADAPEDLIGRRIATTLGELTRDPSKQNTKLIFRISSVDGDRVQTAFVGHQLTRDYIRGLAKRRSSHIDAIVNAKTSDGTKLSVKSSCFTLKKARVKQTKAVRRLVGNVIKTRASELTLNQYVQEITLGKLAADVYKAVKEIYPLRRVEIEKTKVIS